MAGPAIILLAAAIAILPLLVRGPSCGADFVFHYTSWHNALDSWRRGILYPHWTTSANFGVGEPRFVFYPPLTWMLGAVLGWLMPWRFVPIALDFLLLAATGFGTRALARQWLPEAASTLAACVAMFSGFMAYEVYFHSDFATISGGLWIPLLLLFLLRDKQPQAGTWQRAFDGSTVPLALALAGAWLSNAPLGVMATYTLAALAVGTAFVWKSWAPIVRAAVAIALGLGLVGFYLVPAGYEHLWVDIEKLFISPDHIIQNRWITRELTTPHGNAIARKQIRGWIEFFMLALAFSSMAVLWHRRRSVAIEARASRWWALLALVPFAVLFLLLPVSSPVYLLPKLKYLEYPWRWLVLLQAPMAVLFAAAAWSLPRRTRLVVASVCAIAILGFSIFLCSGVPATGHIFVPCARYPAEWSLSVMDQALSANGLGVAGTDEYDTPLDVINEFVPARLPDACLVSDPLTVLSIKPEGPVLAHYTPRSWSPDLHTCLAIFSELPQSRPEHLRFNVNMDASGYLIFRLRSYPAWRIRINGQAPARTPPQRIDGLLAVPVPAGNSDITIDWSTTADVLLGCWLSILSLVLLLALAMVERKSRVQTHV